MKLPLHTKKSNMIFLMIKQKQIQNSEKNIRSKKLRYELLSLRSEVLGKRKSNKFKHWC